MQLSFPSRKSAGLADTRDSKLIIGVVLSSVDACSRGEFGSTNSSASMKSSEGKGRQASSTSETTVAAKIRR